MLYDIELVIPLINEQGEKEGYMYKFIQKRPKYLPRLDERVYTLPDLYLKVESVSYSGLFLDMVRIQLEPLSSEYRKALETSPGNRKNSYWSWHR